MGFKAHDPYIIVEAIISKLVNSIIADCLPTQSENLSHDTTNINVILNYNLL